MLFAQVAQDVLQERPARLRSVSPHLHRQLPFLSRGEAAAPADRGHRVLPHPLHHLAVGNQLLSASPRLFMTR